MVLGTCPFCGAEVRLVHIQNGYAIVCEDKNCLGQMRITFGTCDNEEIFLEKLVSNWNKRKPEVMAVTAAYECIEEYRNAIYDETQEEYDDHGCCCVDVLDEALNRLRCFTSSVAVDVWINRRAGEGKNVCEKSCSVERE